MTLKFISNPSPLYKTKSRIANFYIWRGITPTWETAFDARLLQLILQGANKISQIVKPPRSFEPLSPLQMLLMFASLFPPGNIFGFSKNQTFQPNHVGRMAVLAAMSLLGAGLRVGEIVPSSMGINRSFTKKELRKIPRIGDVIFFIKGRKPTSVSFYSNSVHLQVSLLIDVITKPDSSLIFRAKYTKMTRQRIIYFRHRHLYNSNVIDNIFGD